MSTLDNDNRIKLDPAGYDFEDVNGVTGQRHDSYPAPGQQPRYDWMRSYLIGLLANQSSIYEPTEKRIGTFWFDKNNDVLKVYNGSDWRDFSEFIQVDGQTLSEWIAEAQPIVDSVQPTLTFNGKSSSDNVVSIAVPEDLIDDIVASMRPVVYINGTQVDPRNSRFISGIPTYVELLNGVELNTDDEFTVIIESFAVFIEEDIVVS